jgi:hypothetical protein
MQVSSKKSTKIFGGFFYISKIILSFTEPSNSAPALNFTTFLAVL